MSAPLQIDFYGRNFLVTKDTLVPRPETEQLIDLALTLAGKPYLPGVKAPKSILPKTPKIYDIGTGSGCIAITLKKELPEAEVIASDISKSALEIGKTNAKKLNAPIPFIISNLLDFVKSTSYPTPDLVVANLPYVDRTWDWLDLDSLSKEPEIALFAEDGGLKLIKQLLDQASVLKIPHLLLEADPCQHARLEKYAKGYTVKKIMGYIVWLEFSDVS